MILHLYKKIYIIPPLRTSQRTTEDSLPLPNNHRIYSHFCGSVSLKQVWK